MSIHTRFLTSLYLQFTYTSNDSYFLRCTIVKCQTLVALSGSGLLHVDLQHPATTVFSNTFHQMPSDLLYFYISNGVWCMPFPCCLKLYQTLTTSWWEMVNVILVGVRVHGPKAAWWHSYKERDNKVMSCLLHVCPLPDVQGESNDNSLEGNLNHYQLFTHQIDTKKQSDLDGVDSGIWFKQDHNHYYKSKAFVLSVGFQDAMLPYLSNLCFAYQAELTILLFCRWLESV